MLLYVCFKEKLKEKPETNSNWKNINIKVQLEDKSQRIVLIQGLDKLFQKYLQEKNNIRKKKKVSPDWVLLWVIVLICLGFVCFFLFFFCFLFCFVLFCFVFLSGTGMLRGWYLQESAFQNQVKTWNVQDLHSNWNSCLYLTKSSFMGKGTL